jgi:hypothetical protein
MMDMGDSARSVVSKVMDTTKVETALADAGFVGIFGCAIMGAVVLGLKDTKNIFTPDLSASLNRSEDDIAFGDGTFATVFSGMQMVLYPFFMWMHTYEKRPVMYNLGFLIISLVFFALGYALSLFYTGPGQYDYFTGFLSSFGAAGAGMIFWQAHMILFGLTHDLNFWKSIASYGMFFIAAAIFVGLQPVLFDVTESNIPAATGNLWTIEMTNSLVVCMFFLLIGFVLVNLAALTTKGTGVTADKGKIPWFGYDFWNQAWILLGSACFSFATYYPLTWLRSYVQNQGFTGPGGAPEDEQLISSMYGWGGAIWICVGALLLIFVAQMAKRWKDKDPAALDVSDVVSCAVYWILFIHLAGAMACLIAWSYDAVTTYVDYLNWTFFYGAFSAGAFMYFFFLFSTVWKVKKGTYADANYYHLNRLTLLSAGFTSGLLAAMLTGQLAWDTTDPAHVKLSLQISAGMMGGAALFVMMAAIQNQFRVKNIGGWNYKSIDEYKGD